MRHVQGLAGASAAGESSAADDVNVAVASAATESDGPLFFFDAAGALVLRGRYYGLLQHLDESAESLSLTPFSFMW